MLITKKHHFEKDGQRFFYLADTCWSAFTNASLDDWKYYLDYRKAQGFNVIQINVLKQWDASESDIDILPFPITYEDKAHIDYDYTTLNKSYFDRAEKMLEEVYKRNMIPGLVLLWANYVPGTWAGNIAPNNPFDYEALEEYVEYVVNRFKKYNPIYFISGDTDFPTEESIKYYRKVFRVAKKTDSTALYSFHIKGRFTDLPDEFLNEIDFFSYQSGHNFAGQHTAYDIPMFMRKKGFDRPIVNTEPCYDQISYSRNEYGRFRPYDVRRASYQSILSGADAGITYGAHGIWSWHKTGKRFGIVEGEGFDLPFDWHDALRFRGSNDVALLKKTILNLDSDLKPENINFKNHEEIRVARAGKDYLIYLPVNTQINLEELGVNKQNISFDVLDLQTGRVSQGMWNQHFDGKISLPLCMEDILLIVHTN